MARLLSVFLVFQGVPPLRYSLPDIDPFFLLGISTVQAQGVPEWLVSTVDANHEDRFIQEKIAQLGPGIEAAFAFVRDEVGFEAYTGSLRGARGTLWSDAGNSLDQASLLIALLRGQGIGARYVQGTLSDADAKVLVLAMFDPEILANAVGNIPERYPKADPGNDPGLIAKAKDHWWVELEDGTQLDPVFADGLAWGTPASTYFEVPDAQRHKVVIRLRAEFYNILSNFTYQTPLEHSFSTPELYGKAVTLGHFVNTHQPPALIGGFKTYTYSPWLMVDDNDTDRNNNHLIRGDNYQEFFANLPPVLANSTLTRLTLEMETQDPGKEPELRSRDLLDRLGFAARHGMGPSQGVDSENPALTELDLMTLLITPGFVVPELVPSHQQAVLDLTDESSALGLEVEALINKDPAQITAQDKELAKDYNDLNRAMLIAEGGFMTTAFQLESDFATRKMRDSHLTLAYYDSPRITLFRSRAIQDGADSRLQMELDLRRNHIKALPYPGQNAFNRFTFNMSKGSWDSKLEHAIVERLLATQNPDVRIAASPIAVFRAAKAQGIPLAVLAGPADITARLEGLEISGEARARIASALREGRQVNVPETMVDLDGTPAIGWWEIDMKTGEIIAVSEDGGYQSMVEFVLILALVGTGSLLVLTLFSQNLTEFFVGNQNNTGNFDPFDFNKNNNIDPGWQQEIQGAQPIDAQIIDGVEVGYYDDGSVSFTVDGKTVNLSSEQLALQNTVMQAVGSAGSILDFAGTNVEVISLYAPGPSALSGQISTGAGITLETVPERAFEVKALQACRVASAFRARLSNTGADGTFTLTGAPPRWLEPARRPG